MNAHPAHGAAGAAPHVVSRGTLLRTAGALLALTALTVALAQVDLGQGNVVAALAIASAKATVVALFFMHLRWEHRFHLVILGGAAILAVLMLAFVVFDTTQYQPGLREHEARVRTRTRGGAELPARLEEAR